MTAAVRRAELVIGVIAVLAGIAGIIAASSSTKGVIVGAPDVELSFYTVNVTGGFLLVGIGIVLLVGLAADTPVPTLWVAAGVSALGAVVGLLTWRDDTRNVLGVDGRTVSLLLGLAVSSAALAWAAANPPRA